MITDGTTTTTTTTTVLQPPRLSGTIQVSQYQKGKTSLHLLEKDIVSGSGISLAICKYTPHPRHITMLASHHSDFLQAGCPSCHPTNSIKELKAKRRNKYISSNIQWRQENGTYDHVTDLKKVMSFFTLGCLKASLWLHA